MHSRQRSEHGATAVIVAICLLALFGAGAIAIDLGSGFETKRDLIIDTDSAALAAARVAASEGCNANAQQAALDYLSENFGETVTLAEITYACDTPPSIADPNVVSVEFVDTLGDDQGELTLSAAIGVDEMNVLASSTATFNGVATDEGRLRPIAVCAAHPDVSAMMPPPAGPANPPVQTFISTGKTWKDPACGGGAGNWGYLCFDDANCANGDIQTLMRDGFPRAVDLGSAQGSGAPHPWNPPAGGTDEDCDTDSGAASGYSEWCEIRSGQAFSDNTPERAILNALVGLTFPLLVTDCIGELDATTGACLPGSNSSTFVHPYAFAYVTLHGWCIAKNNVNQSDWHYGLGGAPSPPPYTNQQCVDNSSGSTGDLVLGVTLREVAASGVPQGFVSAADPIVQLCGVDNDTVDHRCRRVDP